MKRKKKLIDKNLHALIGEIVVEFGQLEDSLRYAVSQIVCPAVGYPLNLSIFARVRFSELVEMYDFVVSYAIQETDEEEALAQQDKEHIETTLKALRAKLMNVNERRNRIVHSAFIEIEHTDHSASTTVTEIRLEALKPFLHRRALDGESMYTPFRDIHPEAKKLIEEIKTVHQDILRLDSGVSPIACMMWERYAKWLLGS